MPSVTPLLVVADPVDPMIVPVLSFAAVTPRRTIHWNVVSGTLRMATYVGVSNQYTVDGPEGRTLTVYEQNLGGGSIPRPGDQVRLRWLPEHTFVVRPSEPMADWEEEQ